MGLTIMEKRSITREIAKRYQSSSKHEKTIILNEITQLTGYNRCYASCLLKNYGKKIFTKRVIIVGGDKKRTKSKRPKKYDEKVISILKKIWFICDCICGKRLAALLKEIIPILEKFGEIKINNDTREKLFNISPATIDRSLKGVRLEFCIKGRSTTKPGTLLKNQIPIRTFSQWNEAKPGFAEIDLVSHDGGYVRGDNNQSLDFTDICTTWTEVRAVKNKAQVWVFDALEDIRKSLPFELLGIDSDNGSEFINDHLFRYCEKEKITFTRTRPYRKNDNCFVEQKNYSVVRRHVGYSRYDTDEELKLLNELYRNMNAYINFFQPTMKLTEKTRIGSRVRKKYDLPKTPYRRVMDSKHVPPDKKARLTSQYKKLNPAQLKRNITSIQEELMKMAKVKRDFISKYNNNNQRKIGSGQNVGMRGNELCLKI